MAVTKLGIQTNSYVAGHEPSILNTRLTAEAAMLDACLVPSVAARTPAPMAAAPNSCMLKHRGGFVTASHQLIILPYLTAVHG